MKSDEGPSDEPLLGATGTFIPLESDIEVFRIPLRLKNSFRSQIWIFQTDGSAIIKEIPDLGEEEEAVPIKSK